MVDVMATFQYSPANKIIIHDMYKFDSVNDLLRRLIRPDSPLYLYWCDGIAFVYIPTDTDEAKADFIKGIEHWDVLLYANYENYTPVVEYSDELFRGVKIKVFDYSKVQRFKELVSWLKHQEQQGHKE